MSSPLLWGVGAGVALVLLVGIGVLLFLRRRRQVAEAFGDPPLMARLLGVDLLRPPWGRIVLVLGGAVALAFALADLRWGRGDEAGMAAGGPVVLVIDVSNSMLVEDTRPSRLGWARAAAARLTRELGDVPIGIVVFAGRAYALTPPTRDAGAVDLYLDALDTRMITQTGSALAGALRQSVGLLLAGEADGGTMVVISDGNTDEDPDDLDEAIALTRRARIPVFVIGVGSAGGGPVPDLDPATGERLGFKQEADGKVIESSLGEELLLAVARSSGGAYFPASPAAPERIARLVRARPGGGRGRQVDRPPRFAWFAAAALVLLAVEAGRRR